MGNTVGVITQRGTAGPLAVPSGSQPSIFLAIQAERGLANEPSGTNAAMLGSWALVTGEPSLKRQFGDTTNFAEGSSYSEGYEVLKAFFNKGGARAYVSRIVGSLAVAADVVLDDREGAPQPTLEVAARGPGSWANTLQIRITDGTNADTFALEVLDAAGAVLEEWDNLKVTASYIELVNSESNLIILTDLSAVGPAPENLPVVGTYALNGVTVGVDDEAPVAADIVGSEATGIRTGLRAFRSKSLGRGIIAAPGLDSDPTVVSECSSQEEAFRRIYLSCVDANGTLASAQAQRAEHDSRFTGFYAYRVRVRDIATREIKTISPVGHIAADWFNIVNQKGQAKPPAGADFPINFSLGVEKFSNGIPKIDPTIAATMLADGINPIWDRNGTGPKVWGARAATLDAAWKFLSTAWVWCRLAERGDAALDQVVYEDVDAEFDKNVRAGLYNMLVDEAENGQSFKGIIPAFDEIADPEIHSFGVAAGGDLLTASDETNGDYRAQIWFRDRNTAETIYLTLSKETR